MLAVLTFTQSTQNLNRDHEADLCRCPMEVLSFSRPHFCQCPQVLQEIGNVTPRVDLDDAGMLEGQ